MNTKFFLSGIAGGVVFFLLGYLIYGMLLMDFMKAHAGLATGVNRDPTQMLFLYLILGNLLFGFLLAYIFSKAGISTASKGFVTGAIVGFLVSASYDCVSYATTFISTRPGVLADVVSFTVMSAVGGAVVAWVAGMGKKTA
jgi:hypothetical protein